MSLSVSNSLAEAMLANLTSRSPLGVVMRMVSPSMPSMIPLTRAKDYADWTGHEARIKYAVPVDTAKQVSGIIDGIDGDTVSISSPKGSRTFPFSSIAAAKLLLTDKLINATAPLSTEGADKIEVDPRPGDEVNEHFKTEG